MQLWNLKWCLDKYCQHLLELYQVSLSSVMASEKDQVGATQCAADLEKPWSSILPNRGGIIFQVGSFPLNLSFPFIRITTVSPLSPWTEAEKDWGKECLLAGMIVLQHNVIIRTQFCRTFGENHFARSLTVCWAVRQLLGDSPPGEQLWRTLWGLNYSFRMATCIQPAWDCGEDFASCSSALPDSLLALSASSHFMKKKKDFSQKSKFFVDKT